MAVSLLDIINDYYDLQGDDPPSVPTDQDLRVINRTMEEMVRRHKFAFSRTNQSLSLISLLASLQTSYNYIYDVRSVGGGVGDDVIFKMVDEDMLDSVSYPAFSIIGNLQTGWQLRTNTATYNPLRVEHYQRPSWLGSTSDTTFFPYCEPIALGAYMRKRKIDNPDVDISQEKQEYENAFASLVSWDARMNGRQGRYKGIHEAYGYEVGT